jgi:hypothetical protein
MRRLSAVVLAVGLTAAACGGDRGAGTTTTTGEGPGVTTTTAPPSADGILLTDFDDPGPVGVASEIAAIREANDYRIPLQESLDLFAAVYGPIPGADPARFASDPPEPAVALAALAAHWWDLGEEQRLGALARLGYAGIQSLRSTSVAGPVDAALQGRVDAARAAVAANVGEDVPFPIVIESVPGSTWTGPTVVGGDATPERGGTMAVDGLADRCRIRANEDIAISEYTIVHEVIHCFQFHLAGDLATYFDAEHWITEGSASWGGARIGGEDWVPSTWFDHWIAHRGSLFAVDYAAIGFFWTIESMGADPWTLLRPMLRAGGGEAAVAATGLDPAAVLVRMLAAPARRSVAPALDVAELWDYTPPDVPARGGRFDLVVSPSSPFERTEFKPAFSKHPAGVFTLEGGAIVEVIANSGAGALEFVGDPSRIWHGTFHERFCLEEGWCSCGADEDDLELVGRELVFGVGERGGGTVGFTVRVIDPDDAFTDGRWEGTITATPMGISVEEMTARRDEFTAPFSVTVVDGLVVDGSYTIVAYGQAEGPLGAAEGVGRIPGTFTGCGYAPQMIDGPSEWLITVYTPDGPITVALTLPAEGPMFPTVWVFDPDPPPATRTGRIDVTQAVDWMAAAGVNPTGTVVTFEATRVGDP